MSKESEGLAVAALCRLCWAVLGVYMLCRAGVATRVAKS